MKRWFGCILTFLLILAAPFSSSAYGTRTVQVPELGLSVEIPDDYYCLTRETRAEDPAYEKAGIPKETIDQYMEENSIYLDAWGSPGMYEITLIQAPDSGIDFSAIDGSAVRQSKDFLKEALEAGGFEMTSCDYYKNKTAAFIKTEFFGKENGRDVRKIMYTTSLKDKSLCFTLSIYTENAGKEGERLIKTVIDSIKLSGGKADKNGSGKAGGTLYKDTKNNVVFTVPENWSAAGLSEIPEYWDAKFISDFDSTKVILYGCNDLWANASDEEKKGKTRADFDNSAITKEVAGAMLDADPEDVSTVTYSGYEYYLVTSKYEPSGLEKIFAQNMTCLCRVDNGYLYAFMSSFGSGSTYYSALEELILSVEYPSAKKKADSFHTKAK